MKADDLEKARAFGQSQELRDLMRLCGVIGEPDVSFLTEEQAGS